MSSANHYAQTSAGARYGAHRLVGDRVLQQAPGRSAQGERHVPHVGSGCKSAAAASVELVATGSTVLINADDRTSIRRRGRARCLPARSVSNSTAAVLPRGCVKPSRIDSRSPKPFVDPSHYPVLRSGHAVHGPNHDRAESQIVGKVFQYGA